MAKMTKASLKGLIKECLVELLSEGLGVPQQSLTEGSRRREPVQELRRPQRQQRRQPKRQQKRTSIFDQMDESFQQRFGGNDTTSNLETMATDDVMLQSILNETANTTYRERMKHETNVPSVPRMSAPSLPGPRDAYGMVQENMPEAAYTRRPQPPVQHQAAAGLDINALFGDAAANWSEVLERSTTKKLP